MKFDYHLHSSISKDSDEELMAMVVALRELDFDGMCFTEHLDPFFPDEFEPFFIDWQAYKQKIAAARAMFPELEIYMGIEAGLHPNSYEEIDKQIKENDLDFVLGSMHCTNETTIGEFGYYEKYEKRQAQEDYLTCLIENLKSFDNYDCVAHIGFLSKFAPEPGWEIHYSDFPDHIDTLLKVVIEKGKGIEMNTSGLKNSKYTLPAEDIIKRYKELGGEILTIGSDGHNTEFAGYEFDYGAMIAKRCGFNYAAKYSARQPKFYEL
ncbi:MAG: histidinol-phosphatase HisJ family protein [Clostridia bacterium]|nr:histidinol-phosphatase HisJ family protein [Clostridia bacterium]